MSRSTLGRTSDIGFTMDRDTGSASEGHATPAREVVAAGRIPPKHVTRTYVSRLIDETEIAFHEAMQVASRGVVEHTKARVRLEEEIDRLLVQERAKAVLDDRERRHESGPDLTAK